MKIIVIGVSGTISHAVSEELSQRHDVTRVGHTQGDYQADITSQKSVKALFAQTGGVGAIVSTTGNLHFGPLSTMTDRQFSLGLQGKPLGQTHSALIGQHFLRDSGSITLVSGIVAQESIAQGVNATMVNAGLEGFVRATTCGLPRGVHINLTSPTVLSGSLAAHGGFFPSFASVSATTVMRAYRRSIEGTQIGCIYPVGYQLVSAHRGRRLYQAAIASMLAADYLRPKD